MAKVQPKYDQLCHMQWSPKPSSHACPLLLVGGTDHFIYLECLKILNEQVKNWKQLSIQLSLKF